MAKLRPFIIFQDGGRRRLECAQKNTFAITGHQKWRNSPKAKLTFDYVRDILDSLALMADTHYKQTLIVQLSGTPYHCPTPVSTLLSDKEVFHSVSIIHYPCQTCFAQCLLHS